MRNGVLTSSQQESYLKPGRCWQSYFPYQPLVAGKREPSFIQFLRYSFYRPRDIVTILDLQKEFHSRNKGNLPDQFREADFNNSELQSMYSDYLMGEIKDYLSFYFTDSDYELFRKYFDFLEGKKEFDYEYYNQSYASFDEYLNKNEIKRPKFFDTSDTFLQFLFDLNVICYIEMVQGKRFIRWCFRERNYSNLSPKVKSDCTYQIHYGLIKNLNLGAKTTNGKDRRLQNSKARGWK